MGHLVGKDLYRELGRKIDGTTARAPWSEALRRILVRLYTPEEADLIVRMPYGVATLDRIQAVTGIGPLRLRPLLDRLCDKGLVLDLRDGTRCRYTVSPLIVGIFEFTMMRTRGKVEPEAWAPLFHDYLQDATTYYRANWGGGQVVSPLRALAHEDALHESGHVEILDYDRASAIVAGSKRCAVGICSCRHEKMHVGEKTCDVPLETCSSFDAAADTLIRHGMAREVSREEMNDNLARSREQRLVLCADNVRRDISFICHCCGCCCNILLGVSRFGYPHTVVSSGYVARADDEDCIRCGSCSDACPVQAVTAADNGDGTTVDGSTCLGCGVCVLDCPTGAMTLEERPRRTYCPADTFERVILQSLEQGTLQNLLFDNPGRLTHAFLRGFVGGFLKLPPVKQALLGDRLRSRFLTTLRKSAH